jgi:glyoxylase-like metal-dependent hydrolase (beta-lactamase superfamily II)
MSEQEPPAPLVDASALRRVSEGVWVIGDRRTPLVPNIGIVIGERAALVVDTGIGRANGELVLETARQLAGDRPLSLTITHFHPEHGYGAQAFKGRTPILYNQAQGEDLARKGEAYLAMFRGMGPAIAAALTDTTLVAADELYAGASRTLDLGGRTVELRTWGQAHTNGDQIVFVREDRVLFTGDLAEERTFPIFPWFPPEDADIDAAGWLRALDGCLELAPAIVVPGHGEVGGTEILTDVRGYIVDLRERVAKGRRDGLGETELIAALKPAILAAHPDWHFPEWIDFAIRYFSQRGTEAAP